MPKPRLSKDGHRLRERLAEIGIEVTPDELAQAAQEARGRVQPGPDGKCTRCHKGANEPRSDGGPRDFRFGLCDECAFPERFQ